MLPQVVVTAEGLGTGGTLVWPLSRVRPLVHRQRRVEAESLGTHIAVIRFLPRVAPLVLLQLGQVLEGE